MTRAERIEEALREILRQFAIHGQPHEWSPWHRAALDALALPVEPPASGGDEWRFACLRCGCKFSNGAGVPHHECPETGGDEARCCPECAGMGERWNSGARCPACGGRGTK